MVPIISEVLFSFLITFYYSYCIVSIILSSSLLIFCSPLVFCWCHSLSILFWIFCFQVLKFSIGGHLYFFSKICYFFAYMFRFVIQLRHTCKYSLKYHYDRFFYYILLTFISFWCDTDYFFIILQFKFFQVLHMMIAFLFETWTTVYYIMNIELWIMFKLCFSWPSVTQPWLGIGSIPDYRCAEV